MAKTVPLPGLTALSLMTASLLGYEVLLTRAIAVQHWHHLTAVVVAVALLGLGCAGSLAAALAAPLLRHARGLMSTAALATAVAIPLSLALARLVPLNMLALPWYGPQQAGWLLVYALCYLLPFFCGGVFIVLAFMRWASFIGHCYAADLAGSALGVALALAWLDGLLLPETSLESAFKMIALMPVLAFLLVGSFRWERAAAAGAAAVCVFYGFEAVRAVVAPSDFKALATQLAQREARVLWQQDTSHSRLTLVQSPAQHQAPGLSVRSVREAPRQWQVYRDGDEAVPLLLDAGQAEYRTFFEEVLAGAAYLAAPAHPHVLILPGNPSWSAWNAHWHRAASITLVEPDRGLAELLAGTVYPDRPFLPPGLRLEVVPARRLLQTGQRPFDLIMADTGSSPVGSAATRVQFLLTREALDLMLARLSPSGVLAVTGPVMPLPRDALRLMNSLAEVLRARGLTPAAHFVVIRDWQNLLVLVSRQPFRQDRLGALATWCRQWRFDRAAMPGLQAGEANRFHHKPGALYFEAAQRLLSERAGDFVAAYPFRLAATDDDAPFFYHFFRWGRWQEVKERLGQPWVLYAGWGYLLSLAALAVLIPTAAALILAPLTAGALRRQIAGCRGVILGYFGAIGLGFMFVEIALIQKTLLLMTAPTGAFALVVTAMLLGAGGGSLWSGRGDRRPGLSWGLVLAIGILALASPGLVEWLASRPGAATTWLQVGLLGLFLGVLAFPMGMMLPRGIARIRHRGSGAVAWAWGANGFCSVLGALAAPLVAIEVGFQGVMVWAAGFYVAAALLFARLPGAADRP